MPEYHKLSTTLLECHSYNKIFIKIMKKFIDVCENHTGQGQVDSDPPGQELGNGLKRAEKPQMTRK